MSNRILFLSLCIVAFSPVLGQQMENWIAANEKVPAEKIYIQTDGENYFHNDTIWFKVYLVDSRSGRLIPSAENVYITILNDNGIPVLQSILLAVNGQGYGQVAIPDTIKPGKFMMQAFTNYQLNFGNDGYFYKPITISGISGYSRSSGKSENNLVADVTFLPEGGVLLENVTNLVAFKAINREGFGVVAKGIVKDEKGSVVTTFETDYKGMGILFLTPETGKSYFAQITGFPSFRYEFKPLIGGVKIQLVNHTSKEVIVNIAGNSDKIVDKVLYLANMHHGEVIFYQQFTMDGMNKVMKFESSSMNDGINRLVLLDKNFVPVSERLVFKRPNNVNSLLVQANLNAYKTREEVRIQITDKKYMTPEDFSNVSVSVIHEEAIPEAGWNKNILSQFLIDSELNGFIESSTDLFVDNDLSSDAKLRLVMLINGWKSYFWNGVPAKSESLEYVQSGGFNLKGIATNQLTANPIQNGEITLVIQKDTEVAFLTQKTDNWGNFVFPGLLFSDTAKVYVQAKGEAGNMNTIIDLEPVFKVVDPSESQVKSLKSRGKISDEFSKMKYESFNAMRKYNQSLNHREVKSKKPETSVASDSHFRLYKSADFVLEVDENEKAYENVIDYMVGKIPGVDISDNEVRIRGTSSFSGSSTPLFLVDGVPLTTNPSTGFSIAGAQPENYENGLSKSEEIVINSVKMIPIYDVDKIEVLKSPTNLAVFGVKGANGVIAIYTKHGKKNTGEISTKGVLEKNIVGYSDFRSFYFPNYSPEIQKINKPDLRTTLYWNPDIKTVEGSAEVSFYSSDEVGKYRVFVEGISSDGKICIGSSKFEVKSAN
ncbi:MAG: TonB-dependent receptor plug domain-containing protein [Draconibacterium sp.]